MRKIIPLEKDWVFIKSAKSAAAAALSSGEAICLPHTWNAADGQDGGNDYHRGSCYYIKNLTLPEDYKDKQVYLEFLGAAQIADIYMNGQLLAHHEGGYSTFRVNITKALADENILTVCLNNADNQFCYPQKADFTFYGGLYRMVNLILVPNEHFALDHYGGPGIKVTPTVDLAAKKAKVLVEAWTNGSSPITFTIHDQTQMVPVCEHYARAEFTLENVRLWDGLDDPYLYSASASLSSGDQIEARFGCRSFSIDPQAGFFLNGRPYPLRGVSRHQDRKGVGNALLSKHHDEDMKIIRELGANTLRLAHYQHAQEFYDLCDENGLIVWAEIPYITMQLPSGQENTLSQMTELITQNYNHPSIAVWGLSNEITAASEVNQELLENHRLLHELCHRLDSTRPTVLANVFMLEIDSPLLEIPDINSYNLYFGWYLGELSDTDQFFDEYHAKYPDRVIGFSEYGADANPRFQSAQPEKGDYTEGYQALYHEHMLKMIEKRPYLWATHVWNLFDFAADGRDEGGKHGENQKGLVTFDRQIKKDAFYLYKASWNKKESFVHLCGKRYIDRCEETTEIKVYSNQSKVILLMDGRQIAESEGKTIFRFEVPISGKHKIEARAEGCCDQMEIKKVAAPNPDYTFIKRSPVLNWFDQDSFKAEYFSVADTLAELRANPEAASILDGMMAKSAAERGDVADVVKDNPALQRMMGRMTLISLLKQAGTDEDSIKQLNSILQNIKK